MEQAYAEGLAEFEKSGRARDFLIPVTLASKDKYDFPGVEDFIVSPRFQELTVKIKYD